MFLAVFTSFTDNIYASDLEVEYPAISGQVLSSKTPLPEYAKYLFDLGMFIGFFSVFASLLFAGVLYLLSPAKPDLQADAKDRAVNAISGLLILALTYLIIVTINPELSVLGSGKLEKSPEPNIEQKFPGVYFFKNPNCSEENNQGNIVDVQDFGDSLRNKINSVSTIHDSDAGIRYLTILYDSINFQGKCQYVFTPTGGCMPVGPFAMSA